MHDDREGRVLDCQRHQSGATFVSSDGNRGNDLRQIFEWDAPQRWHDIANGCVGVDGQTFHGPGCW